MPHIAFIGLGSNIGDPPGQLRRAVAGLSGLPDTRVALLSSLYRSAPIGYPDQPEFVNAVAKLETALAPGVLLQALLEIEREHGRERTFRNAPRTLDLDILLYDDVRMHEPGLTLPHPQMHLRAFVLQPLLEIAPDCMIPGVGSAARALQHCRDQVLERVADMAVAARIF
jgi:2-amino-4-hydroxy-6-hydroxymethyldihydropteridine diphosphokinase